MPLSLHRFPKAIIHVDGDAFFASCEIAKDPTLKGKAVITGLERGIVSSLTYEAKRQGISRGTPLKDVKKICPEAIILPSDYETYSLYSLRMYNILKRYTSEVEEYSIDECFADLTGLRRPLHMSYEKMAETIKQQLDEELGITFSLGLAPTKVLAKVASKWKKPSGLTVISGQDISKYLCNLPVKKVWGIGPQTSAYMNKLGIYTALDFISKTEEYIKRHFSKPHYENWQELRGQSVYPLTVGVKDDYQSISKTKTYTPPSTNKEFIFAQLSKNTENACIKARRHGLEAEKIFFFLKTQAFRFTGCEIKLNRPTNLPNELINVMLPSFEKLFQRNTLYRATGIVLMGLKPLGSRQPDLFGASLKAEKYERIFGGLDEISEKYGKHTLFLGSSLPAMYVQHEGERAAMAERRVNGFKDETDRKRIGIPSMGVVR